MKTTLKWGYRLHESRRSEIAADRCLWKFLTTYVQRVKRVCSVRAVLQ